MQMQVCGWGILCTLVTLELYLGASPEDNSNNNKN